MRTREEIIMAPVEFEVTTYKRSIYTQADSGLLWDNREIHVRGLLICEGEGGRRAVVYGLSDDSYMPQNRYQEETQRVFIFARERQFEWFCDLVRNEKPIFCQANPRHPGWFTLTTGAEPIGEEES